MRYTELAAALALSLALSGCGVDRADASDPIQHVLDFQGGDQGVTTGFADYPAGEEEFHELDAGWEAVPDLDGVNGLYLSGNNHSDDLFMYLSRRVSGLAPGTLYDVHFELGYATDVGADCAGIGGSPGSSVYVKVGLSNVEPATIPDGSGDLRMNVDKGNQASGGSDALVVGDMAGSRAGCGDNPYEIKQVDSAGQSFTALSNGAGELWLLAGTDSGFEGTTRIYFTRIQARLSPRN